MILLLIGLALLAYGFYLTESVNDDYAIGSDDWWAMALLGGACCVAAIRARRQRVVIDREYTTKYWGTKTRQQCSNRDIVAIRTRLPGISTLIFEGGGKIGVSSAWPGQAQALHFFRTLLDAKAGSISGRDEWLPLLYLTFPTRCVSCREADFVPQRIQAGWTISMGHARLDRHVTFNIPVCRACSNRRRKGLFAYWALAIALGVGITAAGMSLLDQYLSILLLFFAVVAVINVGLNFLPRWADSRFLGIAATKLKGDRSAVRMWFRDRQLEMEVRLLTEDYRTKSLADVRDYLKR